MIPVHNHSEYSALDGYSTVVEIADRIEQLGLPGAFLTDHGTVAGLTSFAEAMTWKDKKKGLKRDFFFGYGMEAYQAPVSRTIHNKRVRNEDWDDAHHLVILAETSDGLLNLRRISDEAHRTGFYYYPRVDWELLKRYREGLIVTSACMGSFVCQRLMKHDDKQPFYDFVKLFGESFFVELHTYDTPEQRELNKRLVSLAQDCGVPVVYANDAHYAKPAQYEIHEALLCAQYQERLDDPKKHSNVPSDRSKHHPACLYIMGEDEVRQALAYLPEKVVDEAIANSDLLADRCRNIKLPERRLHLPKFKTPDDTTSQAHFIRLVEDGLVEKYGEDAPDEVWDRAEYELRSLVASGLQDYFLIVADYCQWAIRQGIMVGPGRGSAGGSIVANALDITNVDPLKYGLQFERFWNPGRAKGLPDIDIDFANYGRDLVISYVRNLYGAERVAPIGNHIRMRPKSAIDKAAVVLFGPGAQNYGQVKEIKAEIDKTVDAGQQPPWKEMWEMVGRFARGEAIKKGEEYNPDTDHPLEKIRNSSDEMADLFFLAEQFEGRITTYGVHASGVVISDVDLHEWLPCRMASDDENKKVICTQAEMREVDADGFLKGDFLGLRNMDTMMYTAALSGEFGDSEMLCKSIDRVRGARNHGEMVILPDEERDALAAINKHYRSGVNYNHMPDSFWEQIDKGYTLGFFQIEMGGAARRIAKELKPRSIEDLAAIVALNRPGPLRDRDAEGRSTVDRFLARRKGEEETTYAHPILEPILERTYGDFLYQEQVIAFFAAIGYDLGESDHIRKMLGKKLVEEMKEEFPRYVERAERFMPRAVAEQIWQSIVDFSKYSFNKSHAVCYAIILAQTMYAKWRWPVEFVMASIMTNPKRVGDYIQEAGRMQVKVLPPDVNRSQSQISKNGDEILYGLRDIKGMGDEAAKWIVKNGPWDDPEHLIHAIRETPKCPCNMGHFKKIMAAGALDSFGYRLAECETCEGTGRRKAQVPKKNGDGMKNVRVDCENCAASGWITADLPSSNERMKAEIELLGIVLTNPSESLIEEHKDYLNDLTKFDEYDAAERDEKTEIKVPGLITKIDKFKTKPTAWTPNADYAKVKIQWQGAEITFTAWPDKYEEFKYMLKDYALGEFTLITGKGGPKLKRGHRIVG